ncbi:MAG TPA: DUF4097 family beta strand repeat-containing protein [Bryobacteraceae bacterium]|nr:DUF4097 family beta strand repeat-containing protein [Bryobacteraceae bacterium]
MHRVGMILLCALPMAAAAVDESETITRQFTVPAGAEVVVENVMGSIRSKAVDGNEVRAVVRKRLQADSEEQAAEARRDVRFEAAQEGSVVRLRAVWPEHSRESRRRDYRVTFDFELQVPRGARLRLKTVLGEVAATGAGAFEVGTVNGSVELADITGAGTARTVNGKVHASFARNPQEACSFRTVNGGVDVEFQPGLSADLHAKTLNGAVYTDHPVTHLPGAAPAGEGRGTKFVYRSNRTTTVRAGTGGPAFQFETVNGDITIRNRGI